MTNKLIFLIIFIVLVIFGFGLTILNQNNKLNAFLTTKCLKGKCYNIENGIHKVDLYKY